MISVARPGSIRHHAAGTSPSSPRSGAGRWLALVLLVGAGQLAVCAPALAQDPEATTQEVRIRQLEAETRALQQQVFPTGGNAAPGVSSVPGAQPGNTPMTDVLTRMDALEAQVARLTAQYEEMSNHLRQIDTRLYGAPTTAPAPAPQPQSAPQHVIDHPRAPEPLASPPVTHPKEKGPSASRVAAVRAIIKPQTDDSGEDEYTYGFKLWQAKFYPEAEQQLQLFLKKYAHHARASYARNLIGRAYFDDGNKREAASWFLKNYDADAHGDRAPDSLLYLAQSMVELGHNERACAALSQFSSDFSAEAKGRLHEQYQKMRGAVTCS